MSVTEEGFSIAPDIHGFNNAEMDALLPQPAQEDRIPEPLTKDEIRVQKEQLLRAESARLITELDARNKESLRAGNERLGWRVGLEGKDVFILREPVDIHRETKAANLDWKLTDRHYVMVTRAGVRSICFDKGELDENGEPVGHQRKMETIAFDPFLDEHGQPDGEVTYHDMEVTDETGEPVWEKTRNLYSRYEGDETNFLATLQEHEEHFEDGLGDLRYVNRDGSDKRTPEGERVETYPFYSYTFPGFTESNGNGHEQLDMQGRWGRCFYLGGSEHRGRTEILREVPPGIAVEAIKKSKEAASKPKQTEITNLDHQLAAADALLDNL